MSNILADQIFGNSEIPEKLLEEYYFRHERKKQDEAWLKEHKPIILKGMEALEKKKADVGRFRVSYSIPDKSYFDKDKVLEYIASLDNEELWHQCTKYTVDEEGLMLAIEEGKIDLEELKKVAWVEKFDSPRLTVSEVETND